MISMRSITTATAAVLACVGLSACGGNDTPNTTSGPSPSVGRTPSVGVVDLNKLMFHPSNPNCAGTDPATLECVEPAREGLTAIIGGTVVRTISAEERKRDMVVFPGHIGDEVFVSVKGNDNWPMGLLFLCPTSVPGCTDVKAGDTVGINAKYQLHHSAYTGLKDQLDPFVVSIAIHG